MSEPIRLYDHMGTPYVTHSPSVAAQALREGLLFVDPPALPVAQAPSGDARQRAIEEAARLAGVEPYPNMFERGEAASAEPGPDSVPSPDDTQEVPVVPTGRARRRDKGDSGVL